jgi:hypothetical protein
VRQFENLIRDEPPEEFLRTIGIPDRTKTILNKEYWEYDYLVYDDVAGQSVTVVLNMSDVSPVVESYREWSRQQK